MSAIYRKSKAGNMILNTRSYHPKQAIPFGDYVRTKHACFESNVLETKLQDLNFGLGKQSYGKWLQDRASHNIKTRSRDSLLLANKNKNDSTNTNTLVFDMAFIVDVSSKRGGRGCGTCK